MTESILIIIIQDEALLQSSLLPRHISPITNYDNQLNNHLFKEIFPVGWLVAVATMMRFQGVKPCATLESTNNPLMV